MDAREALLRKAIECDFDTEDTIKGIKEYRDLPSGEEADRAYRKFNEEYDCITLVDKDFKRYGLNETSFPKTILVRWLRNTGISGFRVNFRDVLAIKESEMPRIGIAEDMGLFMSRGKLPTEVMLVGIKGEMLDGKRVFTVTASLPPKAYTRYLPKDGKGVGMALGLLTTKSLTEAMGMVNALCHRMVVTWSGNPDDPAHGRDGSLSEKDTMSLVNLALASDNGQKSSKCGVYACPGRRGTIPNRLLKVGASFMDCWEDLLDDDGTKAKSAPEPWEKSGDDEDDETEDLKEERSDE